VYSNTLFKLFKIRTITPVLNANLCEYSTIHNETAEEYRNRLIKQCAVGTSNGRKIWFPFGIQKKPELLKKFNSNSINVTTIGKYEDRKNLNRVAYYLYKISQVNDKKIILTIIGELNSSNSQYLKFLENYCMALQSDKFQIKFLIDVPRDKISDLLSNSQYFILFSECEVASYSQVEAFMNGCKILINCDNGNLDFLPKNERYTIINNMCNFIESIDGNLNSNYIDAEEFTTIYYDLFRSNKIAQRLIQLFETV
jgi:hypothetical protein